ncbi:T7SS effector LXG polymorphic toxin [Listeria goaensis]|uniref:T7SS effector LXG polymorphic toxin n=1 Tax=Listeria goaensis TaxID=1649188 RepID=UPI000B5938A6|nr:T7SS effector LXG polymorphic toxin [Listeria goaensis]
MKIDVQALREHVQEVIQDLKEEQTSLTDAIQATDTFVIQTKESFEGKTADASRAYLQEAYKPVQQKTLDINKLMLTTLQKYVTDAETQFGAYGIVDVPAIKYEYKRELEQMMQEEMQVYRELNQLIEEVNEFVPIEPANLGQLEQLHYDILREITLVEAKLTDFDVKWTVEFEKVEALQEELASMLTKVGNQTITPTNYRKGMMVFNDEKVDFMLNMQAQFGFNEEESKAMYKLYYNLSSKCGEKDGSYLFFSILGTLQYDGMEWKLINGSLFHGGNLDNCGMTESELMLIENAIINQHNICSWSDVESYVKGIYKIEYRELPTEEKEKYNSLFAQFSGKTDFAHMAITTSTILFGKNNGDDYFRELAESVGELYNGIPDVNANAGYIGDIFGTNGARPSMKSDDYKADLDAVNISDRLDSKQSIITVVNDYYSEISAGETNRADEFIMNLGKGSYDNGMDCLVLQYQEHMHNTKAQNITIEDRKVAADFFQNIQNHNNEWVEYE